MKSFLMGLVYFFGMMGGLYIGMMHEQKQKWRFQDYGLYFVFAILAIASGYYALK